MKKAEKMLELVVNNRPTKKDNKKNQLKKMQCRDFRDTLRSPRGREEYLDEII